MGIYVGDKRYAPYVGSTRRKVTLPKPSLRYVQYIEATGTQYLDTGMNPTSTSEFTIDANFINIKTDNVLFSASIAWNFSQLTLFWSNNRYYFAINQRSFQQEDGRCTYKVLGSTLYVDDEQKVTNSWNSNYVNTTLKFFCHGSLSRFSSGKLYGSTFKDNGSLLQNLVPVAIDSVGYMLDTVTGSLFASEVGDFIPGPDINN